MEVDIAKDVEELSSYVADWLVHYAAQVLEKQPRFTIALSGGSTPKKLYQLLASEEYKEKINWSRVHIFWGDERYVPFDDEKNNAKMAFDTLLKHVPVSASQIHIMRTDIDPALSASEYEKILHNYFDGQTHSFDLALLGIGDNAHTLSLFPHYDVIHEQEKWVSAFFLKEQNMYRITLTAPIVNRSACIAYLVTGTDKAEALHHIVSDQFNPDEYPAQIIKPVNGEIYWFVDEAAGAKLELDKG